jgi:hypothetical protein
MHPLTNTLRSVTRQSAGLLALFLVLATGSAVALSGKNTVTSQDIAKGAVKRTDIGANAVNSGNIGDGQVTLADVGPGAIGSDEVVDSGLTGTDVADDALTGADVAEAKLDLPDNSITGNEIDETTLAVPKGARAYAYVPISTCSAQGATCPTRQAKGVTSVTHDNTGIYCVIAPGIDGTTTPAVVAVDFSGTSTPEGNASALTIEDTTCGGADQRGFPVMTTRQREFIVATQDGTRAMSGAAERADDISFTIVIP